MHKIQRAIDKRQMYLSHPITLPWNGGSDMSSRENGKTLAHLKTK